MSWSGLTDVRKQLTFYGAYHSNPTNIFIHVCCVPLIMWSVLLTDAPRPSWLPVFDYKINDYLELEFNYGLIQTALYLGYFFILEPVAALLYAPQMIVSLLTATAFAHKQNALTVAGGVQAFSWVAQFLGHGLAEHRAPALLDNLLGAIVLAPFFVHLEILFQLGYRPNFHKQLNNDIGVEIARIKKIEGDKRRAKEAAKKEL
ncbi:DUF962-domain-containing protein [Peniophora sp. CONT]|nr:DUF962-domain-containing protein [Peniophora sp. CONT]